VANFRICHKSKLKLYTSTFSLYGFPSATSGATKQHQVLLRLGYIARSMERLGNRGPMKLTIPGTASAFGQMIHSRFRLFGGVEILGQAKIKDLDIAC
jgi:hypothetical protein